MLKKPAILHAVAWILFIAYEFALMYMAKPPDDWWEILVCSIPEIGLFYANYEVFKQFVNKAKDFFLKVIPLILLEVILFSVVFISIRISLNFWLDKGTATWVTKPYIAASIFRFTTLLIPSIAYWAIRRTIKKDRELLLEQIKVKDAALAKLKLEQELAKIQLAYTRAQINPHFLINALNMVHARLAQDPQAAQMMVLLSNHLRFGMQEPEQDGMIPIYEECERIEERLTLEELMAGQPLQVLLKIDLKVEHTRIPPLTLLTLIENIFKYAALGDPESPAVIHIYSNQEGWGLTIDNAKLQGKASDSGTRIGLKNTLTRLESAYGAGNVTLEVTESPDRYCLSLSIRKTIKFLSYA